MFVISDKTENEDPVHLKMVYIVKVVFCCHQRPDEATF
jgi:hypothetical protein